LFVDLGGELLLAELQYVSTIITFGEQELVANSKTGVAGLRLQKFSLSCLAKLLKPFLGKYLMLGFIVQKKKSYT